MYRPSDASTARYETRTRTCFDPLILPLKSSSKTAPPAPDPIRAEGIHTKPKTSQPHHPGTSWLRGMVSFSDPPHPLARTALSLVSRRAGPKAEVEKTLHLRTWPPPDSSDLAAQLSFSFLVRILQFQRRNSPTRTKPDLDLKRTPRRERRRKKDEASKADPKLT